MINKYFTFFLVLIFIISSVSAELQFTQNSHVNFRFRCLDQNNSYCSTSTQITISIEDPQGINVADNRSMTANPTYFNYTLPTNKEGTYTAVIVSPTSVNTTTLFEYKVNGTGQGWNQFPIPLFMMVLGIFMVAFGYTSRKVRMFKFMGSILLLVVGVYTIYPGYAGLSSKNILGLVIGIGGIGMGFYFMISDFFEEDYKKEEYYEGYEEEDDDE